MTVNGVGQILNTASVTLNPSTTLTLDNSATNQTGRLASGANAANVAVNNATLNFLGNNTTGTFTAQTLGTLALNSGASFITSQSGPNIGATANLIIDTLTRSAGSTVSFLPVGNAGTNQNLKAPLTRFWSIRSGPESP